MIKRAKIEYKVGTGSEGNLTPLDIFKALFSKATLNCSQNIKIYSQGYVV